MGNENERVPELHIEDVRAFYRHKSSLEGLRAKLQEFEKKHGYVKQPVRQYFDAVLLSILF